MKKCICTYNCSNKDIYSNVAANGLESVLAFGIFQTWFFPQITEGYVILASKVSGKHVIVMLNMSKISGVIAASASSLILNWEKHPFFPMSLVLLESLLKDKVALCFRKDGFVQGPAVGKETSDFSGRQTEALLLKALLRT